MYQTYKANTQKWFDTKPDPHVALLQVSSTSLEQGLPCPVTLPFKHPVGGIIPIIKRPPVNSNDDDKLYEALVKRQIMFLFH